MKKCWKTTGKKATESIEIAVDAGNCWNSKNDIESKLKTNRIWNMVKMVTQGTWMICVYYAWVGKWNS